MNNLQYYMTAREGQRRTELMIEAKKISKHFECFYPGCHHKASGSHVLQENGVLNNIAENGHIMEFAPADIFTPSTFHRVGIGSRSKNKLVFYGFCGSEGNKHDAEVFHAVEDGKSNFTSYRDHLLFSYRALCNGLYQLKTILKYYELVIKDKFLSTSNKATILSLRKKKLYGLKETEFFKNKIENELFNETINKGFIFHRFELPKIDIAASHMFAQSFTPSLTYEQISNLNPLDSSYKSISIPFFINLIPTQNSLIVVLGHITGITDTSVIEGVYVNSLGLLNQDQLIKIISDILVRRIDTWALSESLYNRLEFQDKIAAYMKFSSDYAPGQKQRPLFNHQQRIPMPRDLSNQIRAATFVNFWKNVVPFNLFDSII